MNSKQFLLARTSLQLGLSVKGRRVELRARGEGLHDVIVGTAVPFGYGWLGAWDGNTFPDGSYVLTSVEYVDGRLARSRGVAVEVGH